MTKRKKRRRPGGRPKARQPSENLQAILDRAERLIPQGRAPEAVSLLEPLLDDNPRVAELHYFLGMAYVESGNTWAGLPHYERALQLSRDPGYWVPLATMYVELELQAHAQRAFREIVRNRDYMDPDLVDRARTMLSMTDESLDTMAQSLELTRHRAEQGLHQMEIGLRALHTKDFPASIAANRQAIKLLGDWPPPHNNLSLALFYDGQPQAAIAAARRVLDSHPDNVQALSNTIRLLAWTGREPEARELWPRLSRIEPEDPTDRLKIAEAAAALDEDESLYQLLRTAEAPATEDASGQPLGYQAQFYLAIAEANTGRHRAARRRLKALQRRNPGVDDLLVALEAGQPGPGLASRYPYFSTADLITEQAMEEFLDLAQSRYDVPEEQFRQDMDRFASRFPQIVRLAEKMIWEDDREDAGVVTLDMIGTPAAFEALRRFGLSQAGDDEDRVQALLALVRAGQIAPDEPLWVWKDGEWREMLLRGYEISDAPPVAYDAQVADLLNEGQRVLQAGDDEQAERLFERALELEPQAREAYNNLGSIYARRGQHDRAREMFQAAIEIAPLYAIPRCNLASYMIDDGDLDGAEEMLKPLADARRFHPQEMAFYSFTQARLALAREEYEQALNALEMALDILPEYEPAQDLLHQLNLYLSFDASPYFEAQRQRDQAWRERLQRKLSTLDPSLEEALPLYTKEALAGTARAVILGGGWSALRKAELIQRIIQSLTDRYGLEWAVENLSDDERAALRDVVAHGGQMEWDAFDARYGNDLEESRYWQWHEPETIMGRLRLHGLLVEATVDETLWLVIPADLRTLVSSVLQSDA